LHGQDTIARIGRPLSRNRELAGLISRATRPAWGAASQRRAIPAVRLADETAGRERAGRAANCRAILGRALAQLVERVAAWERRRRNRRLLASFDDRMLRDVGIDRSAAECDSTVSFWRLR
jgi:uncharacterized protein YjiS (DUF1127 family)